MKRRNRISAILPGLIVFLLLTGCGRELPSPAGVRVEFSADHTAQIAWDEVDGADGYRVFKREGSSADYQYICDVVQNHCTDSDLVHGKTYSYKVKTFKDGRLSDGTESSPAAFMGIPAIIGIRTTDEARLAVIWEDTAAETYRLYGETGEGIWELAVETSGTETEFTDAPAYARFCVSAVYQTVTGEYETPRSGYVPLLGSSSITSVTQMDRYTAVVQYDAVNAAGQYRIYRSENETGTYALAGTSYEAVYYDEIEDGKAYFYKVQPVTDIVEGPVSAAVRLGTNAKSVYGVAVFMYHEFVTQEDLNAGVAFDEYAVWADEFEQDLRYLKDNGYTTITSAQLDDFLNGRGTLPDKAVMLTIDDGKLGVYKHAYPLLRKYGMTAVLAVIGERIDHADANPQSRASEAAPYCTWDEIREMSDSGVIEIVSHSYMRHRYRNNGHTGADIADGQSEEAFYQTAFNDFERMDRKLNEVIGKGTVTFSYPYSVHSEASNRAWMNCGYDILLCGDSNAVRHSQLNYYIQDAGVNYYSARTRRLVRLTGTALQLYLENALSNDDWPLD
ncbi:MAG: polysaccharide deacetylase family protein [Clostridiales bacterium]|nr:polysaccharide deacetylase family protein [Clostridiales bacterium]